MVCVINPKERIFISVSTVPLIGKMKNTKKTTWEEDNLTPIVIAVGTLLINDLPKRIIRK